MRINPGLLSPEAARYIEQLEQRIRRLETTAAVGGGAQVFALADGRRVTAPVNDPVEVWIDNQTGGSVGVRRVYEVVQDDPTPDPQDDADGFLARKVLEGDDPTANTDAPIVIGLTAGASGDVIRGVATGITLAEVNVVDIDHTYCGPRSADGAKLTSAMRGPCRLLWHGGSTGTQTCVVQMTGVHDASAALLIGKLDEALNYQSSATMSIWEYNGSADADTTENVTVYDWLLSSGESVATGTQVLAAYVGGRWRVVGAQCA